MGATPLAFPAPKRHTLSHLRVGEEHVPKRRITLPGTDIVRETIEQHIPYPTPHGFRTTEVARDARATSLPSPPQTDRTSRLPPSAYSRFSSACVSAVRAACTSSSVSSISRSAPASFSCLAFPSIRARPRLARRKSRSRRSNSARSAVEEGGLPESAVRARYRDALRDA